MLPKSGVRLAHHFGMVDTQVRIAVGTGRKGHCHTVVVVSVNADKSVGGQFCRCKVVAKEFAIVCFFNADAHLSEFCAERRDAIGFLYLERLKSRKTERLVQHGTRNN